MVCSLRVAVRKREKEVGDSEAVDGRFRESILLLAIDSGWSSSKEIDLTFVLSSPTVVLIFVVTALSFLFEISRATLSEADKEKRGF